MFLPVFLALLLAAASLAPASQAPTLSLAFNPPPGELAPSPQLSDAPKYILQGIVINSVTQEPVGGALVQIFSGPQRSRLTGPDGKFQFENVPPGQVYSRVQKPGFFFAQEMPYAVAGNRSPTLITVGPDVPPTVLQLIPEGVVYGRVSSDTGELLGDLPVHLFLERIENGRKGWGEQQVKTTGDDGEFRFAGLTPGKYFLWVGPSRDALAFADTVDGPQQSAQGYPGVFYPGVPDLASATPIEITPGKQAQLNFSLSLQPFYRISGAIIGVPQDGGVGLSLANAAGQILPSNFNLDRRTGAFQTLRFPAGSYIFRATAQGKNDAGLSASIPINLTSDLSSVRIILQPGASIPISVQLESTRAAPPAGTVTFSRGGELRSGQEPPPINLSLVPVDAVLSPARYGSELVGEPGSRSLRFRGVPPGAYRVEIFPNGAYYVQSARSGSLDLLGQELVVPAGGSVDPIEIVLRDDFSNLAGTVSSNGQHVFGMVLLIPDSGPAQARLQPANPNGDFQFGTLPPGNYKALAIDDAENCEYTNPQVLAKYLPQARDITLTPGQTGKADLELVHVGGPSE